MGNIKLYQTQCVMLHYVTLESIVAIILELNLIFHPSFAFPFTIKLSHVNPWLIHVNVWQNPLQYCKVISLQLIKINEKNIISNIYSNTFKTKSDIAIIFASISRENLESSKEGISIYLSLLFFSSCTLFLFDVPSVLSFLATHFHTYSLSETYWFHFHSWRIFKLIENPGLPFLFFKGLKNDVLLPSSLHGF